MNEKEKELKAFNQCADALNGLDKQSVLKIFQMLSLHFDIVNILPHYSKDSEKQEEVEVKTNSLLIENKLNLNRKETVATKNKSVAKKTKSGQPNYLTEFDFAPNNEISLKEFSSKNNTTSNMEKNVLFVYYLQEILKIDDISIDHIYSCYRHIGLKIPSFPQTLVDTKKRKSWIDTAHMNDIKITRVGLNYVQELNNG